MVGLLQWIKTTCAAAEACMLHTKYLTVTLHLISDENVASADQEPSSAHLNL